MPRLAGLSMEIFADKPARVSRSMDTLQTCGIAPKVLKCNSWVPELLRGRGETRLESAGQIPDH